MASAKDIVTALMVAFAYGIWWIMIDSAPGVGNAFVVAWPLLRGVNAYQAINAFGHFLIPIIVFHRLRPKRVKLAIVGGLVSSMIMDSPLWGFLKENLYGVTPWPGLDWWVWSSRYFNPSDQTTWWILYGLPVTGQLIFFSLAVRAVLVAGLVYWDWRENHWHFVWRWNELT